MDKKKYKPGSKVQSAQDELDQHKGRKPGEFNSQWRPQADDLLKKLQSRDPFSYDAEKDPLYRQAMDQSVRLGRKAMQDTMGRAAAMTGGYGNSYAMTAGQQTYGEYIQALADKMPGFQKLAYEQYRDQGKDLKDLYDLYMSRDKEDYGRYERELQRYLDQEDRLQQKYERESDRDRHDYEDDRDYEYALDRDRRAEEAERQRDKQEQERWEKEWSRQQDRDKTLDEQWLKEFEEDKRRFELEWALKHSHSGSGGGGGRAPATDPRKYQNKHGITEEEYEKKKKNAEKDGHYGPRPIGKPWSPRPSRPAKPNYPVDLRH